MSIEYNVQVLQGDFLLIPPPRIWLIGKQFKKPLGVPKPPHDRTGPLDCVKIQVKTQFQIRDRQSHLFLLIIPFPKFGNGRGKEKNPFHSQN